MTPVSPSLNIGVQIGGSPDAEGDCMSIGTAEA